MFPPDRASLFTNPSLTGSVTWTKTMAIVGVAALAARTVWFSKATMRSTRLRTNSCAVMGSVLIGQISQSDQRFLPSS